MATYYSDPFAASADATGATEVSGTELPSGALLQRHRKIARIPYTFKGNEATNDVVRLIKLPKGTIVVPNHSYFQCPTDSGVDVNVKVGDLDTLAPSPLVDSDDDRYCAAVAVEAATTTTSVAFAGGVAQGNEYALNEECWITMTFTAVSTPADGGVINVILAYDQIV